MGSSVARRERSLMNIGLNQQSRLERFICGYKIGYLSTIHAESSERTIETLFQKSLIKFVIS